MTMAASPAAEARATLAAIGCDLVAAYGGPGDRRAAALLKHLAGAEDAAATLDDLPGAPDWMRLPRAAQRGLAIRVALLAMGRTLATSIDGDWLGRLSDVAGEDVLDWAIATIPDLPPCDAPCHSGAIEADALVAQGFALLRTQVAPGLQGYLGWAPGDVRPACPPTAIEACLAAALRGAGA